MAALIPIYIMHATPLVAGLTAHDASCRTSVDIITGGNNSGPTGSAVGGVDAIKVLPGISLSPLPDTAVEQQHLWQPTMPYNACTALTETAKVPYCIPVAAMFLLLLAG
jgi:hypothetical protein